MYIYLNVIYLFYFCLSIIDASNNTISGRFYGQGSSSQAAGYERPLSQTANVESSEQREEIAHVQYDIRVLHPSRRNGAKWYCSFFYVSFII